MNSVPGVMWLESKADSASSAACVLAPNYKRAAWVRRRTQATQLVLFYLKILFTIVNLSLVHHSASFAVLLCSTFFRSLP